MGKSELKSPKKKTLYMREWRAKNPIRNAENAKHQYYAKHEEKLKYYRDWKKANYESYRESQKKSQIKIKTDVLSRYSKNGFPECVCCGERILEFLTIDHINNDGHKQNMGIRKAIYYWLKKHGYPDGFQTLCMNCQFGKRINKGVCPHQTKKVKET